jgi:hypothetical protein
MVVIMAERLYENLSSRVIKKRAEIKEMFAGNKLIKPLENSSKPAQTSLNTLKGNGSNHLNDQEMTTITNYFQYALKQLNLLMNTTSAQQIVKIQ